MSAHHIQEFLVSLGETEMAQEVLQMSNRLEAFADGLDKVALDSAITAAEEAIQRGERLEQQLTEREKQVVMMRDTLEQVTDRMNASDWARVGKALAATQDLSGLVLCDAKPVAWRYENKNVKGNWYITWTKPDDSFNQRGLHERKQP
jgi:hypothetical protein